MDNMNPALAHEDDTIFRCTCGAEMLDWQRDDHVCPQVDANRLLAEWDRRSLRELRMSIADAHAHTTNEERLCGRRTTVAEVCADCYGTGEVVRVDGAPVACGECSGRGYMEGER